MNTIKSKLIAGSIVLSALIAPIAAQANPHYNHSVNGRWNHQQHRIGDGVGSGELTARETARIERQEARMRAHEAYDRHQNDGNLTGAERRRFEHRENHMSREIYRQKHDDDRR